MDFQIFVQMADQITVCVTTIILVCVIHILQDVVDIDHQIVFPPGHVLVIQVVISVSTIRVQPVGGFGFP